MNLRRALLGILAAQGVLLALLGWHFRHALNPDAVAYLRLASYYAEGRLDLAVSGYWGPLLSWVLAVGLKLGLGPLLAARVVMAFSAMAFVIGAVEIYRALKLPAAWSVSGTLLAALAGACWSVQFITPDLLLSAWIALAASRMLDGRWLRGGWPAAQTGMFWGLAYLTKAVALPLGALAILCFAALAWRNFRREEFQRAGITIAVFILLALPWMVVLTKKYGRPTFSTTARISHALTGPPDEERFHPFARHFHQPEPGRVTSWEDPSRMDYNYWSPFASAAYARHEAKVLAQNFLIILALFTSINLAWPLWVVIWTMSPRAASERQVWTRLFIIPALLFLIYLPCYMALAQQRFFFALLPFIHGGLALGSQATGDLTPRWQTLGKFLFNRQVVIVATVIPLLALLLLVGDRMAIAGECAVELAGRFRQARVTGSFAGSANLPGGRTGLYVSFLLGQPWHGDESQPTPASIKASGADFFLVNRGSRLAEELSRDVTFGNLDSRLFTTAEEAHQFPVMVFQMGE